MIENIESLTQYLSIIKANNKAIYRGHSSHAYKLLPSVGRDWEGSKEALIELEKRALSEFKLQAVPFIKYRPEHDLEWLVLMQHHGTPTRLLDWTFNPVVALYFSVCSKENKDGVVYQILPRLFKKLSDVKDIFQAKKSFVFSPRHITERIGPQSGCFIAHSNPLVEIVLDPKKIKKYNIPNQAKKPIRNELSRIGVHEGILFPGIDGLCKSLKSSMDSEIESSWLL